MSYSEKFQLVKDSIIAGCKRRIINNWQQMFDMWLSCEACMEFPDEYEKHFKAQFSEYMNDEVETKIWVSGKNIVYAINTFMEYKKNAKLNDVLNFTEKFICNQLDDFDNWCDEILMAFPDIDENTEEIPTSNINQNAEDNPS